MPARAVNKMMRDPNDARQARLPAALYSFA
jgi:hypothetical protein